MATWRRTLSRLAAAVDRRLDGGVPLPPRRIVAYRGWGDHEEVVVSGRVLADPPIARSEEADPWWRNLHAALRRLQSDEVPAARIIAAMDGDETEALTDREGYFRARLRPASLPRDTDWHRIRLRLAEDPAIHSDGWVLTPGPAARIGVISDLDDTVIRSEIGSLFRMVRGVLLRNARTRLPFPGVARFYEALRSGAAGGERNPLFYVSSSPWNLYELLVEFMEHHGVPDGPLVLRDWGLSEESFPLGGHAVHKLAHLRDILARYPTLPFILLGDSGQEDPEVYRRVALEFPGRIPAVYIRDVASHPARRAAIHALGAELRNAGTDLVVAADTVAVAEHAATRGWIADRSVEEVKQEVAAAHERPAPAPGTGR